MLKVSIPILVAVLLVAAVFGTLHAARGQAPTLPGNVQVVGSESEGESLREIYAPAGLDMPQAPSISFIDSQTPACVQPDPAKDECFLKWYYLYVDAGASTYMNAMTVTINELGVAARFGGFFQQSMSVPYDMMDNGIKVACGALNESGKPTLGKGYGWTIRAKASDGLKSANYGTTYCPPYIP